MNIEELKEKKEKASQEIFYILKRLEDETKTVVDSISLTRVDKLDGSELVGLNIRLDL